MKGKSRYLRARLLRNVFFLLALLSLLGGTLSWKLGGGTREADRDFRSFVGKLHSRMEVLEEEFRALEADTGSATLLERLERNSLRYQDWALERGISLFYFEGGELSYWSDNSIALMNSRGDPFSRDFVSLRNADYVSVRHRHGDHFLVGLVEVRSHYPIENKYLENRYHFEYRLDPEVKLLYFEEDGCRPVHSADGSYLFSLDFREAYMKDRGPGPVARTLMALAFLLLLTAVFTAVRSAGKKASVYWFWAFNLMLLVLLYLFFRLDLATHGQLSGLPLFQPDLFASRAFPSMGHLCLFTLTVLGLALNAYFNAPWKSRSGKYLSIVRALIYFILASVLIMLVEQLLQTLVLDSGISFELHRITVVSVHSLFALILLLCWFLVIGLVLDRAITCMGQKRWIIFLTGVLVFSLVFILARLLDPGASCWSCLAFAAALLGAQIYLRYGNPARIPFSRMILVTMVLSVFLVIRFQQHNVEKLERLKEIELVKYASEHDHVAERLFEGLSKTIRRDSLLAGHFYPDYVDIDPLATQL